MVVYPPVSGEGLRKLRCKINNLIFGPGLRTSPAYHCSVAGPAKIPVDDFVAMSKIDEDGCAASFRKSVTMQTYAGCGGEFNENVFVVELDRIVTGRGRFIAMLETPGWRAPERRHHEDIAVVGNAGAAQMGVTEAVDF